MDSNEVMREFELFRHNDYRQAQIRRGAFLLESLLRIQPPRTALVREIVRVARSAPDYRTTIDFISASALARLVSWHGAAGKGNLVKEQLEPGTRFEQMYPLEAACTSLLRAHSEKLEHELSAVAYGSLITAEEFGRFLNVGVLRNSLPDLPLGCPAPALSRYCAAGLDSQLLAASSRGRDLLVLREQSCACLDCPTCRSKM